MTDTLIARLIAADKAGEDRANAMVPGAVFLGAMPEAIACGHYSDKHERAVFISSFLAGLRRPIVTDQSGVIQ